MPKISRKNYDNFATFVGRFIESKTLEERINASFEGNRQLDVGNLLMPPLDLDKQFIPVLSLECNFGSCPAIMRVCVGMFSFVQEHKPVLFAIRFESAHFNSNHDFCHGQFTREFEYESRKLDESGKPKKNRFSSLPDWMPNHIPCIIVPAKDPVSIILCMLISFYGERIRINISDLDIGSKQLEALSYLPKK